MRAVWLMFEGLVTLLVAAAGAEVLSSALPKEAEEIEKLVGK